ncbi:Endonuclease YncB, thermonuclease family [Haladaptatus litoreus]|uniref:Endonuclease YncB, thermonuclease family n=1 Tax=Haladaptatus litoreus TaxID=553468 RepID=A0A1N7BLS0_9EURY|nr:lamin tail domain-containing protein [Haladaptatus litoreus]SIR52124.1 Endonuclease YncB, thermonuclease family [Haladaptatus litoreus]
MRRRTFLSALATATASAPITAQLSSEVRAASGQISPVECYSAASFTNASGGELTDSSVIAVWAEDTATNNDGDGNGDATIYSSGTPIPVVTAESNVVAFGSMLVEDSTNWQQGNEEFVLNTWDDELGGSGTVLWDNGHGQYYSLGKFSNFESYAEDNGYTVTGTSNLTGNLGSADAVVITSPTQSFTNSELSDLSNFVASGGSVFLHGQSDYSDYDETANMNDIASYLGLSFRFNDDEVLDTTNNGGADYAPLTDQFNTSFDYFADRTGLGLDKDKTYTVDVTEVTDGDTATVEFSDGSTESIRILGIDTPEKAANSSAERVQEWEGIESLDYLGTWGSNATTYATGELDGKTVDLSFDSEEPVRDAFGRVLGYIHYDADGSGTRDDFYNRNAVRDGFARVYGSGFGYHDSFWSAEDTARSNGTNVWGQSDPENTTEIRNRAVDDLFFPTTASVVTSTGGVADSRVPVYAESTATQNGGYSYSGDIPLAAVDESTNVAMLGSPLIDEGYESGEGFAVDTAGYENFVFLTNLIDYLTEATGDVLIDGGHGQFSAGYALSNDDAAYYQRFLEGVGISFEQSNSLDTFDLSRWRAVVVTTPADSFTQAEIDALSSFAADGGAVILVGAGTAPSGARTNLNDLASGLGSDLRLNDDQVTDGSNNVNGDSAIPTTTAFDTTFPLFEAYDGSLGGGDGGDDGDSGELVVAEIHEDAEGDDTNNLNDEYVVFENTGSGDLDLTGWYVQDEVEKTYSFPSGFTLGAGEQVTLHTGTGTDTQTDLYWGNTGSAVWNNGGDTVYVYDDSDSQYLSESY